MKTEVRRGFTLVELLVVISIIGVLMSLLLPAVQSAREAGRRTQCANNQKNLALALIQYEGSNKKFPGYVNQLGGNETDLRAGWLVMIFPYIEQNQLWDLWTAVPANPRGTNLEISVCPSNPSVSGGDAPMAYAVNTGLMLRNDSDPSKNQFAANGVFFNHYDYDSTGALVADPLATPILKTKSSIDYVGTFDGTTNTIMVGENNQLQSWVIPLVGLDRSSSIPTPKEHVGFCWYLEESDPVLDAAHTINENNEIGNMNSASSPLIPADFARLASYHPGGVNVAFCDGRVYFLAESVEDKVLRQLTTSNSKQSDDPTGGRFGPGTEYILNKSDY